MPHFFSPFPYHFLALPGRTEMAYLDEGPENAPILLFLHGLGDNAHIWHQTISGLKNKFRCLALDLPGHGRTVVGNFGFQMHEYAEVVSQFVNKLGITAFSLIGHSMGGQIGIIVGLRLPALIEKLVLVAPAGFEQFTEVDKKLLQLGASYGNNWHSNKNATVTARKATLQKSMEGMFTEPVFDFLPLLQIPTLVIFGEQDAFIPNRYLHSQSTATIARNGTSQIPKASLQLFPHCGHYPQVEQPQQCKEALIGFFEKLN